jgi:N-acetyl-anhydromuramyl-L-alanine amidase AmpD
LRNLEFVPSRKVDPNPNFSWEILSGEGYGLWYDEVLAIPKQQMIT